MFIKSKSTLVLFLLLIFTFSLFFACDDGGGSTTPSYTALEEAIEGAGAAKADVVVSSDGSDVLTGVEWVTADVLAAFEKAIDTAEKAMEQATTQALINEAVAKLKEAIDDFEKAKKSGTKIVSTVKADPVITLWPSAAAITYGAALSTSVLTGGVFEPAGSFAWTYGGTIPTVTNSGYSVTFTPNDTANYNTLTYDVSITVNRRDLSNTSVTVGEIIRYTGSEHTPAPTVTDSGLITGDDYNVLNYINNKNAGTATVTITATAGGNYTGIQGGNFTINKAILTVKADDKSITLGDIAPVYTYTAAGFVGSDTVAVINGVLESAYSQGDPVGGYPIDYGTLSSDNYNFTFKSGMLWVITSDGMMFIPAGSFYMGSPNTEIGRWASEGPQRTVELNSFYMSVYQITQEQWSSVMTGNVNNISTNPSHYHGGSGREPASGEIQGKRPVEFVSWYAVLVFCNRLSLSEGLTPAYRINSSVNPDDWGNVPSISNAMWDGVTVADGSTGYRLPTEAQWEYACRAGTTTAFSNGTDDYDDRDALEGIGWFSFNSTMITHEVGKKAANTWGFYDMHGNVFEWCWDWWSTTYYEGRPSPDIEPQGANTGTYRQIRGGCYSAGAQFARSAYRNDAHNPNSGNNILSFRLVRP